jgi:hypothetical protein
MTEEFQRRIASLENKVGRGPGDRGSRAARRACAVGRARGPGAAATSQPLVARHLQRRAANAAPLRPAIEKPAACRPHPCAAGFGASEGARRAKSERQGRRRVWRSAQGKGGPRGAAHGGGREAQQARAGPGGHHQAAAGPGGEGARGRHRGAAFAAGSRAREMCVARRVRRCMAAGVALGFARRPPPQLVFYVLFFKPAARRAARLHGSPRAPPALCRAGPGAGGVRRERAARSAAGGGAVRVRGPAPRPRRGGAGPGGICRGGAAGGGTLPEAGGGPARRRGPCAPPLMPRKDRGALLRPGGVPGHGKWLPPSRRTLAGAAAHALGLRKRWAAEAVGCRSGGLPKRGAAVPTPPNSPAHAPSAAAPRPRRPAGAFGGADAGRGGRAQGTRGAGGVAVPEDLTARSEAGALWGYRRTGPRAGAAALAPFSSPWEGAPGAGRGRKRGPDSVA